MLHFYFSNKTNHALWIFPTIALILTLVAEALVQMSVVRAKAVEQAAIAQQRADFARKTKDAALIVQRQAAAEQRAIHEAHLKWQKAHPAEYAAQRVAAAKAAEAQRVAAAKAAAAENNSESMTSAAPQVSEEDTSHCEDFGHQFDSLRAGSILMSFDCKYFDGIVRVHVTINDDAWTSTSYDKHLRLAQLLWKLCVVYARPSRPDSCHVKLVGEAGEDLGGSSDFFGSQIDVRRN